MGQVLVLNSSYLPINAISWQKAICLTYTDKAEVVLDKDEIVHSPSIDMKIPSVIRLKSYNKIPRINVNFNKKNIFLRDSYTCQYCGKKLSPNELTLDHVIPKKHGGKTNWVNIVAACENCNFFKSERTPKQAGMTLLSRPKNPYYAPYLLIKRCASQFDLETWEPFFVM